MVKDKREGRERHESYINNRMFDHFVRLMAFNFPLSDKDIKDAKTLAGVLHRDIDSEVMKERIRFDGLGFKNYNWKDGWTGGDF